MLALTERAGAVLTQILDRLGANDGRCVRLDMASPQMGIRFDRHQLGDETVRFGDRDVLALDPYTAEKCAGLLLDYDGLLFVLVAPDLMVQAHDAALHSN